jgi:hypothetical protein
MTMPHILWYSQAAAAAAEEEEEEEMYWNNEIVPNRPCLCPLLLSLYPSC